MCYVGDGLGAEWHQDSTLLGDLATRGLLAQTRLWVLRSGPPLNH